MSRKPFRELSCNSNVRTNLEPDDDREVLRGIVCVKLKDDIHSPGELKGQMMVLKEHVKARYRLSDLIRSQKSDKMTSNLSKWIRIGDKEKSDLEEDSYKISSQFYKERRSHIAQPHTTTYHPQTNRLVERHNRTLVNMLRVYCS